MIGYWLGEAGFIELVRRRGLRASAATLPQSNLIANLLLLFPALVLTDLLLTRGPIFFVPMLLLFLLFLALIALYVGASTAREEFLQERTRFVQAAVGQTFIPPDILEERAMELTHELRSPLTAILGYAGLLAREAGTSDREREESYVASITASSNYMLRLVNNILDLQRLETDTQPLQLRPIDLPLLLTEALASIQPRAAEKHVRTSLAVEPGLPPLVAHELLLRRAVDNILSNAVKYTRPGDEIRLTANREADGVAIAVADTGIGLTGEERDRLFERFFPAGAQRRASSEARGWAWPSSARRCGSLMARCGWRARLAWAALSPSGCPCKSRTRRARGMVPWATRRSVRGARLVESRRLPPGVASTIAAAS